MAERGVNKAIIVGRLGQAPEVRYMPNGGAVANLSLATSETWRDKATGEQKEKTEWHRVVVFGKLAEIAGEYLQIGTQVYIEGQLRTRNWQDDAGVTRYSTEIVVSQKGTMQMLGGGSNNRQATDNTPAQSSEAQQPAAAKPAANASTKGSSAAKGKKAADKAKTTQQPQPQPQEAEYPPDWSDDIPF